MVLEHQFWDLEVSEECFSVTLSFQNKPERLVIPFDAITAFADPAVKFGLQFQESAGEPDPAPAEPGPGKPEAAAEKPGEVVALDAFRKK